MTQNRIFFSIFLIGFGLYFAFKQFVFPTFQPVDERPIYLFIIGLCFLFQGMISKDYTSYFPAIVLLGISIQLIGPQWIPLWPNHWAIYTFIIGLAFLFQRQKQRSMFLGIFFFALSFIGLFVPPLSLMMNKIVLIVETYWSICMIVCGLYLFLIRKTRF